MQPCAPDEVPPCRGRSPDLSRALGNGFELHGSRNDAAEVGRFFP